MVIICFTVQPNLSQRIRLIPTDHTTRAGAIQRLNDRRSANTIIAVVHRPCEICAVSKELSRTVIELEANLCCSGESIRHPLTGNAVHPRTVIPNRNIRSVRIVPCMDKRRLRCAILQINGCTFDRRHHCRFTTGDFCIVFRFVAVGCTNPTTSQLSPAQHISALVFGIRQRNVAITAASHHESVAARSRAILRAKTNNAEAETSLVPAGLGRVDGELATNKRQAFSFHSIGFVWRLPLAKRRLSFRRSHIHVSANPSRDTIIFLSVRSVIAHRDVLWCTNGSFDLRVVRHRRLRHQRGNGGGEHHRYRRKRSEQAGLCRCGQPLAAPVLHPHRFFPFLLLLPGPGGPEGSSKFSRRYPSAGCRGDSGCNPSQSHPSSTGSNVFILHMYCILLEAEYNACITDKLNRLRRTLQTFASAFRRRPESGIIRDCRSRRFIQSRDPYYGNQSDAFPHTLFTIPLTHGFHDAAHPAIAARLHRFQQPNHPAATCCAAPRRTKTAHLPLPDNVRILQSIRHRLPRPSPHSSTRLPPSSGPRWSPTPD